MVVSLDGSGEGGAKSIFSLISKLPPGREVTSPPAGRKKVVKTRIRRKRYQNIYISYI